MVAVHFVMMMPAVHSHRLTGCASVHAGARCRLARSRTAGLRAAASRPSGGLCNCESARQREGSSQNYCRNFHGRFLKAAISPEKKAR
jgi:hypothetical protein